MKKFISQTLIGTLCLTSALASAAPAVTASPNLHSGITPESTMPVGKVLDELEMRVLDGKVVMLPWILGITGIDLALIGVFWGTYVPYMVEPAPQFHDGMTGG